MNTKQKPSRSKQRQETDGCWTTPEKRQAFRRCWNAFKKFLHTLSPLVSRKASDRLHRAELREAHVEHQRLAEEFSEGYLSGWRECYAACLDAVETEMRTGEGLWAAGELLVGDLKTPLKMN